jgi:hypothetical protein
MMIGEYLAWLVLGLALGGALYGFRVFLRLLREVDAPSPNIIRPGGAPAAPKRARSMHRDETKCGETSIASTTPGSVLPLVVVGAAVAWALSESASSDSSSSFDASQLGTGE